MNHVNPEITSTIDNNQVELVENKLILGLNKFWRFCLFYGDYLASLHAKQKIKKVKS
ncbi:hypothetical protein [Pleurocapsa sp. CCALA 161]|uniref:hypothetical protein n=1 Tax=Pleurocapsa sp. CCALA 161 TaxID=2107688 RepID=UPI001304847E|nr:hypothetical protein [Pleurocapsa sp. CCALA 161]